MATTLKINGEQKTFEAPDDMPLLWVLRDVLGMTGTKFGCGIAQCGACTVHIDGKPVRSCMLPVGAVRDRAVTTIEGVGATPAGAKVQKAWLDLEVIQCGYCQSGQIMSAAALLAATPNPDDSDIDAAMAGNICRCGTYVRIRAAIKRAASRTLVGGDHDRCEQWLPTDRSRRAPADRRPGGRLPARLPSSGARRATSRCRHGDARRAVRAQRLHPHRHGRQDDAGHAAGRDGPGHLHRDGHDPRRGTRRGLLPRWRCEHAPPNDKLYANPLLGIQATGNSNSVRAFWMPLAQGRRRRARHAGAGGRPAVAGRAGELHGVERAGDAHATAAASLSYGDLARGREQRDAAERRRRSRTPRISR